MNKKSIKLTFYKLTLLFIIIASFFAIFISCASASKDEILDNFSNNLYKYPLPPNTIIMEKTKCQGKNWIDGGGSGGYWNVGATMKLSTKLTQEEILNYYKDAKFPYPKSNQLEVILEIYFEGDYKKVEYKVGNDSGFYYRSNKGYIYEIDRYFDKNGGIKSLEIKENNQNLIYIIQILSGYDYFLNID